MPKPSSSKSTSPARNARKSGNGPILLVGVTRSSGRPMHRQVYEGLRRRILEGSLSPGARLPSTRMLAEDLRVSRSTVVQAFDQLSEEGYIETTSRGPTRVSRRLPESLTSAGPSARTGRQRLGSRPLSGRAQRISDAWPRFAVATGQAPRPFRTSVPALDVFPIDVWGRLMARRWRRASPASLAYGDPRGLPALREAVATYLTNARAVRCSPDQVLVTAGSQQALDLVARAVLDEGDQVWMEDPGYFGAARAFAAAGARPIPIPVDAEGLSVAAGLQRAPRARLAFVTPARQLPLGVTMTLRRRLELLAWASTARAWVLEDDYDSEFRYSTRPLASLQGLDAHGSVIFVGTFSKVMLPSFRLGYIVAPTSLVEPLLTIRGVADICPPPLTQAVMADFMSQGHFDRHIRRMRGIYHARQRLLASLISKSLGRRVEVDAPDAGMNLIVWLPESVDDHAAARALGAAGVDALPISSCALEHRIRPGLVLGFSGIREPDLRTGVATLQRVLSSLIDSQP